MSQHIPVLPPCEDNIGLVDYFKLNGHSDQSTNVQLMPRVGIHCEPDYPCMMVHYYSDTRILEGEMI